MTIVAAHGEIATLWKYNSKPLVVWCGSTFAWNAAIIPVRYYVDHYELRALNDVERRQTQANNVHAFVVTCKYGHMYRGGISTGCERCVHDRTYDIVTFIQFWEDVVPRYEKTNGIRKWDCL